VYAPLPVTVNRKPIMALSNSSYLGQMHPH
jgi:hypothetical protein